ncbi:MAG: glucosidase, partial [Verrucomicrobiales bacterium]|nr:glucosidase [Verrucomicrobiales bacterium]
MSDQTSKSAEQTRLDEVNAGAKKWHRWGPYISERQWGTVREDYSANGTAWEYFPHEHARSRAYRWGEDGLGGICDRLQRICFSLALWNGKDPILKERLFGLTNSEGNHGEDVKELYYYLDATPTNSYLKMLYKYPQREFPYAELVQRNRVRDRVCSEFELLDTGIFDDDHYFDIFIEYAKGGPDDLLILITAHNRGPDPATIHFLPQIWFRNTWSWGLSTSVHPNMSSKKHGRIDLQHPTLDGFHLHYQDDPMRLFCENETNPKIFGDSNSSSGF